jgi:hypothetical protein
LLKLLSGLGGFQGVFEGLGGVGCAAGDTPSVVEVAEGGDGAVMDIWVIDGSANFIERIPVPGEFDFGGVALFRNASDGDEFPSGGEDVEAILGGVVGRD